MAVFLTGAGVAPFSLPEGYTKLTYIQSTGTQYIDTKVVGKSSLKVRLKFSMTELTGYCIIGYYNDSSDSFRLFNYDGECYLDFGNSSSDRIHGGSMAASTLHDVEFGNKYVKNISTGANIISGDPVSPFTRTSTICIFGNQEYSKGIVYSGQIDDNGTLVRDYTPCINPSGAIGLYDLVGKQFYGNAGTGEFIGG